MAFLRKLSALLALSVLVGCETATEPAPDPEPPLVGNPDLLVTSELGGSSFAVGAGEFLFSSASLGDIPTKFVFVGGVTRHGRAFGRFRQRLTIQGTLIDVSGRVTCITFDAKNGRAWIGGVVTKNRSEGFFTRDIHQPGRDVWFRVLDTGHGATEADRSTLPGFEGGGGIITSAEYCEVQSWPDDNARTHPVTKGGILLRP